MKILVVDDDGCQLHTWAATLMNDTSVWCISAICISNSLVTRTRRGLAAFR